MNWTIHRLTEADAPAYRELRLEALRTHPEAFGADFEDEAGHDVDWFAERIGRSAVFGASADDQLLGSSTFFRVAERKSAHLGMLVAMYVRPAARGSGAALRLVEAVLEHAAGEVIQVHLGVGVDNLPARRLYEKAGFEIYGTEPRSLHVNGRYIDEHLMVRFLDKAPGKSGQ